MPLFIDQLRPADCLAEAVARSPYARGALRELGLPELPEGCWALQAAGIPGQPLLEFQDARVPVLAADRILHPGQALALFGAPEPELAAELAAAVRLSVEAEPPLEWAADAPQAGAAWGWRRGEPEQAFARAAHVVEAEYRVAGLPALAVDPVGAVAEWEGRTLLVHALTADPLDLRRQLAGLLDLPERRVRVRAAACGPLAGRQLPALLAAAHAALLAWRSGRAARLICDPREQAQWGAGSPAAVIRHRTALDANGLPVAARVSLLLEAGACPPEGHRALEQAARCAEPPCPSLELEAAWGRSSRTPADPLAGGEAAWFASELHASRLQEVAGLDPYEWRRLAGRLRGQEREVLEKAVGLADFRRRHAACAAARQRRGQARSPRGIGLALCSQEDEGQAAVRLAMGRDGALRICTALAALEPWLAGLFRRQAARLLELDPASIEVEADTRDLPPGPAATMGRALGPGLRLLELCCRQLRRRGPATITRRSRGGRPERSWAAAVVEVEADQDTLELRCRNLWLVIDAGRVAEESLYRAFAAGEAVRALGRIAPGPPRGRSCGSTRQPPLVVHFLQPGPGARGSGYRSWDQLPSLGIAPAFAAAAAQATGLFLDQLPLGPEVIQQCLEAE